MPHIFHVLPRTDWQKFKEKGEYRPDSLIGQGFVHCSKPGQIVVVADYNYADNDESVLLLLDESKIKTPVRYETDKDGRKSAFPHVYGPLKLDHVVETFPYEQDETGFRLLKNYYATVLHPPLQNRDHSLNTLSVCSTVELAANSYDPHGLLHTTRVSVTGNGGY